MMSSSVVLVAFQNYIDFHVPTPTSMASSHDVLPVPLPPLRSRSSSRASRRHHKRQDSAIGPGEATSLFARCAAVGSNYMFAGRSQLLSSCIRPSLDYTSHHDHMHSNFNKSAHRMVKSGIRVSPSKMDNKIKGFRATYGGNHLCVAQKLTSEQIISGLPLLVSAALLICCLWCLGRLRSGCVLQKG